MAFEQPSPMTKFENSPAESFLSAPGDNFTSLFSAASPSATSTMNPMEMMSPQSFIDDDEDESRLSVVPEEESSTSSDKKPSKKRKSWGQVLPEPKTNLPPRKRAKTDDEKEQRRVERVLRNRRAAQSSRERKRLEVEALEQRNQQLEELLINAQKANLMLVEELNRFRRNSGVVTRSSSPLDPLRDSVTLSQQLFGVSEEANQTNSEQTLVDELMRSTSNPTVNPASLSPELGPIPDSTDESTQESSSTTAETQSSQKTSAFSSDLTQHPAEVLCDLQCQSEEMPKSFLASQTQMSTRLACFLQLRMMLLSAWAILSACQRPLTQIALSSKAGFSLLPTPQLLTTIIWLVTLPPTSTSSTSTNSSTTKQTTSLQTLWQRATTPLRTTGSNSRSTTLRLKSLRNILSSSPSLARPLMDATMVALRLVSEGRDNRVGTLQCEPSATRGNDDQLTRSLSSIVLPSREVLLTLLWALKVEERRSQRRNLARLEPEIGAPEQPTQQYVLKVAGVKRPRTSRVSGGCPKRRRLMR